MRWDPEDYRGIESVSHVTSEPSEGSNGYYADVMLNAQSCHYFIYYEKNNYEQLFGIPAVMGIQTLTRDGFYLSDW